jgi:uncharacterized protein (DUF4213/DUF364 family)
MREQEREMKDIAEQWFEDLQAVLARASFTVPDVRIGVFYTAARLSTGHVGVAFTPRDLSDTVCCPRSAAAAPHAGRLAGQDAWALGENALSPIPLRRAVGVAVLNALSALAMARYGVPDGRLLASVDALAAAEVGPNDRVAMVGAFVPFIKALKGKVAELWVVDKHPQALKPDEVQFWRSPQQAGEVLSQASVVVISGSSLVEGGLDDLLAPVRNARCVVLAGPTASPWPSTFFARGIHILGGIRVLDGDKLLQVVSEGGSGYFFEDFAEKVCILR